MSHEDQTIERIAEQQIDQTIAAASDEIEYEVVQAPEATAPGEAVAEKGDADSGASQPITLEVKADAAGSDKPGGAANADASIGVEPLSATPELGAPEMDEPRVLVIGVGGAGGNAVNTMIRRELAGVEYLAANTDAQALSGSLASSRLQLGRDLTRGHGAGGKPEIGQKSAEESAEGIRKALDGAHMCFIAAGMGGGTGTGAAPAIAEIARELGVLTVGVVSKPFDFEGPRRRKLAEAGVAALAEVVDTIIVIPNQNLFRVASEKTTFTEAFCLANEVLHQGVKGVTDLMFKPGLVNLDFSDVRAVMGGMGSAMMGAGEAEGDGRARLAAEKAVDNPLLDDITLRGAKGVLINITGGPDMTLMDVEAAASRVRQDADPDADIFFGSTIEEEMEGRVRVSVVATGVQRQEAQSAAPSAVFVSAPSPKPSAAPVTSTVTSTVTPPTAGAPRTAREEASAAPAAPAGIRDQAAPVDAQAQSPRVKIGGASEEPRREPIAPSASRDLKPDAAPSLSPKPTSTQPASAEPAAPSEPPVAGSSGLRSDDLVRRITETMGPRVSAERAKPEAQTGSAAESAVAEKPRSLGSSRPARKDGKFEIPNFLRRQPG